MSLRHRLQATESLPFWLDHRQELKNRIHRRLVEEYEAAGARNEMAHDEIRQMVRSLLAQEAEPLTHDERVRLTNEIIDEVLGLGPIEPLVRDPLVTEVMVNHPKQVYIERFGKLEKTMIQFKDDRHVIRIIEKIVTPVGRRIDEAQPYVDARLPDGSRVNATIPPLALNGPCLTIRKFSRDPYTIDDLIRFGTLTPDLAEFLQACVQARLNILITGGSGTGKTTTLNVLSTFIPEDERIITIEDAAELQLKQEHWVRLETRPPNIEGKGQVTQRDLVRNALRMRPDRIIVGEVRGGEALDMLQAMNTGHEGSMTTAHANAPRDGLARVETMVLMAGMDLPSRAIREQMASALHLVVHISRFRDGTRKITRVAEITGMEGNTITMQDIFAYRQEGVDKQGTVTGHHAATGIRPRFFERFEVMGVTLRPEIFYV